jgi:hypothetical protein
MKDAFHQWLEQLQATPGLLACGVRFTDRSSLNRSWSPEFPDGAFDNAWRCVADSFDVLRINELPEQRMRWVFAHAVLYAERRPDGICLGLFTTRDLWDKAVTGLEPIIAEFHAVA